VVYLAFLLRFSEYLPVGQAVGLAFFQIDWPDLHLGARRMMNGGQAAAVQAVLGDMMEALEASGHYGESGWTPLLGQVGPQANIKAIFKWKPLS
jgi:hypothetical protein